MKTPDFRFALRALKYRNYKLFFSGQIVSLIGTWLTMVATNWLVYRLSRESGNSAAYSGMILGVVGFCSQVPQLILAPFAGVWVDRLSRHKVLVGTQFLSMLQSFALAFLALTKIITIPWIIILNVFQGLVNAFDMPARQSLTVDLVENRADLGNAIALSASMMHAARLIGPAIAGFLIFRFGEGSCFLIDGFSYLAVMIALLCMRLKPHQPAKHAVKFTKAFREGWDYSMKSHVIKALLKVIATMTIFTMSLQVLMPIIANDVLGGGERTYGLLLCASGFGALCATLYLAGRKSIVGLGRIIGIASLVLGAALVCFSFTRTLWLSMIFLTLTGGAMVIQIASANTIVQTIVEDSKRGRVMSLFSMSFMGVMPLGSLFCGWASKLIGPVWTMAMCGVACVITGYLFLKQLPVLRQSSRELYIKLGLLPSVDSAR